MAKKNIEKLLELQEGLAEEARGLTGDNSDSVRHAVMAVVKDIGSVRNALDTNEALSR